MEIWKDIANYEGLYQVSSEGRVRRVDSYVNTGIKHSEQKLHKGRILKQRLKRNGYLTVDLSKDQIVKTISVHRLVATAFIDKDNDKNEVNHINCNRQDNRVENLEWVTHKENQAHAKANNRFNPPNRKQVRCPQLNMTFNSSYEAAEYLVEHMFKGTKTVKNVACKIRSCVSGFQTKAYGLQWEHLQ